MKYYGCLVIIICCLLLQPFNLGLARYMLIFSPNFNTLILVSFQGLMFLVYPFLGHLADVYLTRYRILRCSTIFTLFGGLCGVASSVSAILSLYWITPYLKNIMSVVYAVTYFASVIGIGSYEANAIQFGLDQLLESPTLILISFIHWYYWSQTVGRVIVFYIEIIGFYFVRACEPLLIRLIACTCIIVVSLGAMAALTLLCIFKKHLYIQRAGLNPFKNIYKVLKYSWKHKIPEHRSAFTYWEEDIPPRIDLGKDKYGGPFTNEEVEDTKTFLRILPLLLCLFGYHLAGDGYSAPEQLLRTSCPSLPVLLLIVFNPLHMSALVTVVGIPLYRLVIMKLVPKIKKVQMLTKMWIGLYLSLLQVVLYIIVVVNHDTRYWLQRQVTVPYHTLDKSVSTSICYCIRTGYDSRVCNQSLNNNEPVDNTYLWFIIPQLLNGLSSLLVSMTVFEFICAQAPRTTQGLLIGLWYATFSIRYLVVGVLDSYITEKKSWLICEGVKGFLILVSLVLFSYVSRNYRYRQRDEIVNVQGMIEDIYERQLDQEEEYMQEQREFYRNFHAYKAI